MMIVRATAIPLACHPYSSTSRVVHWLTRRQGKVSTILKGALRPKSPFLGEYELFGTSELLYYRKRIGMLHAGMECALLHPRPSFRIHWRAMQTASYLSALFNKTTPDEAYQPGLFELYEQFLDLTEQYGESFPFLIWTELKFCDHHGHAPYLERCMLCSSDRNLRFSATAGGIVCSVCERTDKLSCIDCPPDVLAILRSWQKADRPGTVIKTRLSEKQQFLINAILGAFMDCHFQLPPGHRNAVHIAGSH